MTRLFILSKVSALDTSGNIVSVIQDSIEQKNAKVGEIWSGSNREYEPSKLLGDNPIPLAFIGDFKPTLCYHRIKDKKVVVFILMLKKAPKKGYHKTQDYFSIRVPNNPNLVWEEKTLDDAIKLANDYYSRYIK